MTGTVQRFITDCLTQAQIRLAGTCEGLTDGQLRWRPAPAANNIGFILWHLSRNEDARIANSGGLLDLWVTDEWHRNFGQPVTSPDPGDRLGFRSLSIPKLEVLLGYSEAVHQRTIDFVRDLSPEELDREMGPAEPGQTVAGSLRHVITHKNHHHGQIDYLRGLQQEDWDLPRGTGGVLR